MKQSIQPLEVIVVDDCSKDNTKDIVMSFLEKYPIVKYVCLGNNSGAQAARNIGIKVAKGEWIAFLDSDDEWIHDKLEKQIEMLRKYEYCFKTVIHGDYITYCHTQKKRSIWHLPIIEGDHVYAELLTVPGPMFQAMLVSKIALKKIGYLDERVPSYQEWDTSIRLAKFCRYVHIREPLFIYHNHSGETMSKDSRNGIKGYGYIIFKFENEIKQICGMKTWNDHLKTQIVNCLNNSQFDDAEYFLNYVYLNRAELNSKWKYWVLSMLVRFKISADLGRKIFILIRKKISFNIF